VSERVALLVVVLFFGGSIGLVVFWDWLLRVRCVRQKQRQHIFELIFELSSRVRKLEKGE